MNQIGIMQGRLSPPRTDRIQGFPRDSWEFEFKRAAELGYDGIEWLFEVEDYRENPIWSDEGRQRIRDLTAETGVTTPSICADYFMAHPFFRARGSDAEASVEVLVRLIAHAAEIGAGCILLPILEEAEIRTPDEVDQLLSRLVKPLQKAEEMGVSLGLETELPAQEYADLVRRAGSAHCGVYLDVGNATAKGYNVTNDVPVYADLLCGLHIKDRKIGGATVLLGTGDCDLEGLGKALQVASYRHPCILQTAFTEDYMGIARSNLAKARQVLGGDQTAEEGRKRT
jgi:L-ribulose-5-phosphate 3-epimerase